MHTESKPSITKAKLILITVFCLNIVLTAQNIGINGTGATAHNSALLDVDAGTSNNKGMLIPRIPLTALNVAAPVASPAISLLVYNTASAGVGTNAVIPGYYYWEGTKWVRLLNTNSVGNEWNTLGNSGTSPLTNFLGTTDGAGLVFRTNNLERVRITGADGRVGIGTTPDNSAILDVSAPDKGFLMPRVGLLSSTDVVTIPAPVTGLQVYNTNFTATLSKGICYFDGTKWLNVSTYIPAGSGYFVQTSAITIPNNGVTTVMPFGPSATSIVAPESGIYQANIRTFAGTTGASAPILPIDQTAFYYEVYVNGVISESVEYYTYKTQVIATSATLRYSANVGDVITFRYRVAIGYSLAFSAGNFARNNVVISKVQ